MPAWLSVKPVNTPNAYSGISAEMLPLKTTIRTPASDGEEDDPVGEHEPVAAVGELAGQVAVAGDDRRQPGEVGVGGVGGQDQDGERGELGHPEQHALAAVDVLGHQGDAGRVVLAAVRAGGARPGSTRRGSTSPRIAAHDGDRHRGVACSPACGTPARRWTRPRRRTARRRPTRTPAAASGCSSALVPSASSWASVGELVERDRAEVLDEDPVQADDDQQHQHDDVEVRRRGEQRRPTPSARAGWRPSSRRSARRHSGTRHCAVEAERRLDRQHAAGDRHGDGEDVVGQQRRPGDERRRLAEVLAGHDVGPAARRVGVDRLAVRDDDDHQQDARRRSPAGRAGSTPRRRSRPGRAARRGSRRSRTPSTRWRRRRRPAGRCACCSRWWPSSEVAIGRPISSRLATVALPTGISTSFEAPGAAGAATAGHPCTVGDAPHSSPGRDPTGSPGGSSGDPFARNRRDHDVRRGTMSIERFPVEASHILMFARAVGDPNPIYADEAHAAGTEVGGIIAPPTFAQSSAQFDPDYFLRPKVGQPWFGSGKEPTGVSREQQGGRELGAVGRRPARRAALHLPPPAAPRRRADGHDQARQDVGEGGQALRQARLRRDDHRVPRPGRRARHHRHGASASAPNASSRAEEARHGPAQRAT